MVSLGRVRDGGLLLRLMHLSARRLAAIKKVGGGRALTPGKSADAGMDWGLFDAGSGSAGDLAGVRISVGRSKRGRCCGWAGFEPRGS